MTQTVENRMVINSVWKNLESREKLCGNGYFNPHTGIFVPEESALDYIIEIIKGDRDRADDVMEYFYKDWEKEEKH